MNNNKKLLSLFAIPSFIIFGIVSIVDFIPEFYRLISLLPLINCICYLILILAIGGKKQNIATTLIIPLTFIRYSIIPLLFVLSNYHSIFSLSREYINGDLAIILMIYENICVTLALILSNRTKYKNKIKFQKINKLTLSHTTYLLLLYCLVFAVLFPESMPFKSILEISENDFISRDIEIYNVGTIQRILKTLFSTIFNVIRILLPVYIIHKLDKQSKSDITIISYTVFFVIIQFFFLTTTFAESIVASMVVLLTACSIRHNVSKRLLKVVPFFVMFIIVFYFYFRYTSENSLYSKSGNFISYLSSLVNAYFTGIDNVVAIQNIPTSVNKIDIFQSSYQSTIPFNSTLFGPRGDSIQVVYNRYNHIGGQIPPTIGIGYYFYGFIFAPLFSFLQAFFAVKFSIIANNSKSILYYSAYIFISVCLSLGFSMYNEIISLSWCFGWGIPLYLIAYFSRKKI